MLGNSSFQLRRRTGTPQHVYTVGMISHTWYLRFENQNMASVHFWCDLSGTIFLMNIEKHERIVPACMISTVHHRQSWRLNTFICNRLGYKITENNKCLNLSTEISKKCQNYLIRWFLVRAWCCFLNPRPWETKAGLSLWVSVLPSLYDKF